MWVSVDEATKRFEAKLHVGHERTLGMTPHIFILSKSVGRGCWRVVKICGLHGCGYDIKRIHGSNGIFYGITPLRERWVAEIWSTKRTEDLRFGKDTGYELSDVDKNDYEIDEILAETLIKVERRTF